VIEFPFEFRRSDTTSEEIGLNAAAILAAPDFQSSVGEKPKMNRRFIEIGAFSVYFARNSRFFPGSQGNTVQPHGGIDPLPLNAPV
jgi:hypothetical protein